MQVIAYKYECIRKLFSCFFVYLNKEVNIMKKLLIIILAVFIMNSFTAYRIKNEKAVVDKKVNTLAKLNEVVVEPQCKPSMGFSFSIPENWEYEIITSDDIPTSKTSATLRPKNAGKDEVIIIEYVEGFAVCGTGLREDKINFNGYEAVKGFYDGNKLWSFISLRGDYRDCVIINSAPSWYDDYEDDINLILASVKFKHYE